MSHEHLRDVVTLSVAARRARDRHASANPAGRVRRPGQRCLHPHLHIQPRRYPHLCGPVLSHALVQSECSPVIASAPRIAVVPSRYWLHSFISSRRHCRNALPDPLRRLALRVPDRSQRAQDVAAADLVHPHVPEHGVGVVPERSLPLRRRPLVRLTACRWGTHSPPIRKSEQPLSPHTLRAASRTLPSRASAAVRFRRMAPDLPDPPRRPV